MSRPVPAKLKILHGNPGKRPVKEEVQPIQEIPDCPDYVEMNTEAKATWDYYLPILAGMGCFYSADVAALANLCLVHADLLFHLRKVQEMNASSEGGIGGVVIVSGETGYMSRNPLYDNLRNLITQEMKLCGELGLTPVSRTKLHPEGKKQEKADPWSEL